MFLLCVDLSKPEFAIPYFSKCSISYRTKHSVSSYAAKDINRIWESLPRSKHKIKHTNSHKSSLCGVLSNPAIKWLKTTDLICFLIIHVPFFLSKKRPNFKVFHYHWKLSDPWRTVPLQTLSHSAGFRRNLPPPPPRTQWSRRIQCTPSYPTSEMNCNIILSSMTTSSKRPLPFKLKKTVCTSKFSHACYVPHPSKPPPSDHINNIWWS